MTFHRVFDLSAKFFCGECRQPLACDNRFSSSTVARFECVAHVPCSRQGIVLEYVFPTLHLKEAEDQTKDAQR